MNLNLFKFWVIAVIMALLVTFVCVLMEKVKYDKQERIDNPSH